LGTAELFLQHCQVPNLSPAEHLKALTDKLATKTTNSATTPKVNTLLKNFPTHLDALIKPPPAAAELRVPASMPTVPTPQMELQRVSNSPAIMQTRDPMAKRNLIKTKQTHQLKTHNNTPGWIPAIQRMLVVTIPASDAPPLPPRRSP
jgi:hypothetical protein